VIGRRVRVGRTAAVDPAGAGRNPHAPADADPLRVLTFLHEAGDLNHLPLVRPDLRHQSLLPVHTQVHALGNVGPAYLIFSLGARGEDVSLHTAGHGDAHAA